MFPASTQNFFKKSLFSSWPPDYIQNFREYPPRAFAMAHAEVQVPGTLWRELGVLWLAVGMPTGMIYFVSRVKQSLFLSDFELLIR